MLTVSVLLLVGLTISTALPQPEIKRNDLVINDLEKCNNKTKGIDGIEGVGHFNEYTDKLMEELKVYMSNNNQDPFKLPDLTEIFGSIMPGVPFKGKFTLTNGWMQGLSSIYRKDNVVLILQDKAIYVSLPLALKYVVIDYEYGVKFLGLTLDGSVTGRVSEIDFNVKLGYEPTTEKFCLKKFSVEDAERISISFSGNNLTDKILNILSRITTSLFKHVILNVLEERMGQFIEAAVDGLNDKGVNITIPFDELEIVSPSTFLN